MHQTVKILGDDSIYVGSNMLPFIAEETCRELRASSYIIVTDTNVAKLHLEQVKKQFIKFLNSDQRLLVYLVPPGEINKTRKTKELLEDYFLLQKCTRDSCVIALGGIIMFNFRRSYWRFGRIYGCYFYAWSTSCPNSNDASGNGGFIGRWENRN
jgi:3-dehydroquinate synthetase